MVTKTVAAVLDTEKVDRLLANQDTPDANFADSFIGDEAVWQITDALFNNSAKTRVFLDRNCIGAGGAAALGDMLKVNNSISFLSLEWNNIGTFEQGIQSLADGLEVNGSLETLILCNNHIAVQGARCLARALRANSTLKELDLRWNDVGGDGARALRDSLHTNRALISLKLSGNKVDDYLMENIEAALSDRQSGAMAQTMLLDNLHVTREKAEKLEARLRRQTAEEETHRRVERERERKWQEEITRGKEDSSRSRLDSERQMEASAKQMAELEEKLVHEQSRTVNLSAKLEREGERRQTTQDELDQTKQTLAETKRDLTRQVEKLQEALDSANEDRRVTQAELERTRNVLEDELIALKDELRTANTAMETIKRASTRATAEAEQATSLLDTARAEVRLTAERADEATAGMARAARDGVTTLDETRRMYEERVEAIKLECEARMRAAEDRSRAVEHERQRAEMSRQATCKELTRLQVLMEERISQTEKRILTEAQKQFELELAELRERINAVHKARESKESQAREHLASLEELRLRSTAELRDFSRELAANGQELEKARDTARSHEGRASKLQTEVHILRRAVEGLQQRVEEAERDKHHASEVHSTNMSKIQLQHATELAEAERRGLETRKAYSAVEERATSTEERLAALKQTHLQDLHALQRSIDQVFTEAVVSTRQRVEIVP